MYQRVKNRGRRQGSEVERKCTKQSKAGGESSERWCKAKKAKILQLQQADTQKGECAYAHVSQPGAKWRVVGV